MARLFCRHRWKQIGVADDLYIGPCTVVECQECGQRKLEQTSPGFEATAF
jgi:hypothetical protein